jgi:hypothetical protein
MITVYFTRGEPVTVPGGETVEYVKDRWPGSGRSQTVGAGALLVKDAGGTVLARFAATKVRGYVFQPGVTTTRDRMRRDDRPETTGTDNTPDATDKATAGPATDRCEDGSRPSSSRGPAAA